MEVKKEEESKESEKAAVEVEKTAEKAPEAKVETPAKPEESLEDSVTVVKDEKAQPKVVDDHVAKDQAADAAGKEAPAPVAKQEPIKDEVKELPKKKQRPNLAVGIEKLKNSEKLDAEEV